MKLLCYYILTQKALNRWKRTIGLQRQVLPSWEELDKVVVASKDVVIPEIRAEVIHMDMFDDSTGLIKFSPIKNAAISLAISGGYDWLLDMDADTVLTKPISVYPPTGFGSVPVYLGKQGEGLEVMRTKILSGESLPYQGSSRFLIRRDAFTQYKYDERMLGYAGEDFDYFETIAHTYNFYGSDTDARCVHFWHPLDGRGYGKWTFRERRVERGEGPW